ncbi:smad nuclear interacting protein 1 [Armillaria luteobubalina]|uniref:Smad nuclear interacting protein 1 n=1 Tax=Armillaria luteobubalina TaxID=153913 RepID=A0AA39QJ99_9AGAR|nr:smad nuclear interacting protein 1 [Armillaria luteobubalina]
MSSSSKRRRDDYSYDQDRSRRRDRDDDFERRHRDGDERRPREREQDRKPKDRRDRDYSYGYGERDREQERKRDRERYDQDSRRSASPRRRRSGSGSRSASPPKAKPNFGASGLLAAETNTARKPVLGWRLYVFKGTEQVELLHIQRQSAYLFGRDRLVADIPIDHPSCSKQHAVIQYRYIQEKNEFGDVKGSVKPFIIDLESTNGTHVNDEVVPPSRYYELRASDVIKFGLSTKEYVLLHDEAAS